MPHSGSLLVKVHFICLNEDILKCLYVTFEIHNSFIPMNSKHFQ